jgi:hypothetical protein
MIKKHILLAIISIFLISCGFSPIYVEKNNSNLKIEKISFKGDKLINNYLNLYLKRYSKNESSKNFIINTNTQYYKKVLSKDATGEAVDYELSVSTKFSITLNSKFIKDIIIKEKFIMKNDSDQYNRKKYENSIKQNFANSTYEKLIIQLSGLE